MLQQPHCSHRLQTNLGVSQRQASLPHTYSRSPSPLLSPFSPLRLLGVIHLSLSSPPRSLRPSPCPFSSSSSNILPIADGFQLAGLPGAAGWEPPACPPPPHQRGEQGLPRYLRPPPRTFLCSGTSRARFTPLPFEPGPVSFAQISLWSSDCSSYQLCLVIG